MRKRGTYVTLGIIGGGMVGAGAFLGYGGAVSPAIILFGAIVGGMIGEELYREKLRRAEIEKILRERKRKLRGRTKT